MSRAQHEQLLVRKEEDHLLSFNIIQLTDSVKYREGMFEKNPQRGVKKIMKFKTKQAVNNNISVPFA